MEFNTWESGRWIMPISEADRVRRIVRAAVDDHATRVLRSAEELHTAFGQESAAVYRQRLDEAHTPLWMSCASYMLNASVRRLLDVGLSGLQPQDLVRAPAVDDLDAIGLATTDQTMTFHLFDADIDEPPVIEFEDSGAVSWHVPYGDRAVEDARNTPTYRALITGLESVNWGDNGGGVIRSGGDDVSVGNRRLLDGSQITASHGPLGERIGALVSESNELMAQAETLLNY